MAVIAALVEHAGTVLALRRSLPRSQGRVASCRTPRALGQLLQRHVVDALLVSPRWSRSAEGQTLLRAYPHLPLALVAPFRPDDGALLLECHQDGASAILVEGVDEAVLGEVLCRISLTAARAKGLRDAPRVLRLSDPLQVRVWEHLVAHVDTPVRTSSLAARLRVSREHLSRQFGAGGAPNLKRVIDLTRVVAAAQLLANPGYSVDQVSRLLGFASSSHLTNTARRVAGIPARELGSQTPVQLLAAFSRGKTRSRV